MKLPIKALSLNHAYIGRRWSTAELTTFKKNVGLLLPKIQLPKGRLKVSYIFGVSTKNSDGDNLVKCFQDCLADKYAFNDNQIYKWEIEKVLVPKGQEFIDFEIEEYNVVEK